MIMTVLNWCYITLIAFILGVGVTQLIKSSTGYDCNETDVILFTGIAAVTAYAQIFSLFYKVGALANIVLFAVCPIIVILCRSKFHDIFTAVKKNSVRRVKDRKFYICAGMLLLLIVFFVVIAVQRAYHVDTDGYHAQSIRWIEEFGAVKGIGNLYHRLAYNSAFMCFQALFSWVFLIGQSMHVGNAYLCLAVACYALATISFYKDTRMRGSDFFKILILLYLGTDSVVGILASPNTDTFVLMFILYILAKWCEYNESGENRAEAYGNLCLLGVFALTLKLSVAMVLLLTIRPAAEMLSKKKWKTIFTYVGAGLFILIPYCARNVIISGYLIYPYPAIDLFDVDWKMLPYEVDFDRKEIMAYGRGIYEVGQYDLKITGWFPAWWEAQAVWVKAMLAVNIILLPVCLLKYIRYRRGKDVGVYDKFIGPIVLIQFLYWMFTAPLARYGMVFLFIVPCMLLAFFAEEIRPNPKAAVFLSGIMLCLFAVNVVRCTERIPMKRSSYYVLRECNEVQWEGISVYLPVEDGNMGYYYLPATQHESMLQYIELRGNDIREGFQVKEEYRGCEIDTYGGMRGLSL